MGAWRIPFEEFEPGKWSAEKAGLTVVIEDSGDRWDLSVTEGEKLLKTSALRKASAPYETWRFDEARALLESVVREQEA